MPKTYRIPPEPPHNEGKTIAAWTLNLGVVLGVIIVAFGLAQASTALMIAGAVVVVLSLVLGFVLSKAGLGQKKKTA